MAIERFTKRQLERKRYTLDYSDWLDAGETVTTANFSVSPATSPAFFIDGSSIVGSGTQVDFYANSGADGTTYTVTATVQTSAAQTKQDLVLFTVRGS